MWVRQVEAEPVCAMSPLMCHIQRQANASIMAHQFPVACGKPNLSSATPAHEAKWPFRGNVYVFAQ